MLNKNSISCSSFVPADQFCRSSSDRQGPRLSSNRRSTARTTRTPSRSKHEGYGRFGRSGLGPGVRVRSVVAARAFSLRRSFPVPRLSRSFRSSRNLHLALRVSLICRPAAASVTTTEAKECEVCETVFYPRCHGIRTLLLRHASPGRFSTLRNLLPILPAGRWRNQKDAEEKEGEEPEGGAGGKAP